MTPPTLHLKAISCLNLSVKHQGAPGSDGLSQNLGVPRACSATWPNEGTHREKHHPRLETIALPSLAARLLCGEKVELPTVRRNPAPASYISDRDAVPDEEPVRRFGQVGFHGTIEATGLVCIAIDTVLNLLRCVSYKYLVSIR